MPIVQLIPEEQTALMQEPPLTVQEREHFTQWLTEFKTAVTHIFLATATDESWVSSDSDPVLQINIVGNNSRPTLAQGMYCVDLPAGVPDKYRDAIALAVAHFGMCPDNVKRVPELMAILLNPPTAHEKIAAKMFIKNLITENADNPDIVEWATQLAQ